MFPRAPDQHKSNKPLVPNGLGVFYVLASTIYLFVLHFRNIGITEKGASPALTLAVCVLFGGFLGLLDDWMDLKWRYKAFLPIVAALPLASLAYNLEWLRLSISILGLTVYFGESYYFLIIPLLVTIFTNTINQLGGLNGLETVCPAIVMVGLMVSRGSGAILMCGPLLAWILLTALNVKGKIFVGNTGSFAIGMTLAAFAIISDLKLNLAISLLPYIFNSTLILTTFFFFRSRAQVTFDGEKLSSDHKRSLITMITYGRRVTERKVVLIISLLVATSTAFAVSLSWLPI